MRYYCYLSEVRKLYYLMIFALFVNHSIVAQTNWVSLCGGSSVIWGTSNNVSAGKQLGVSGGRTTLIGLRYGAEISNSNYLVGPSYYEVGASSLIFGYEFNAGLVSFTVDGKPSYRFSVLQELNSWTSPSSFSRFDFIVSPKIGIQVGELSSLVFSIGAEYGLMSVDNEDVSQGFSRGIHRSFLLSITNKFDN